MNTIKFCSVIAGIVIIECVALANGIDGMILGATIAILGGIGGYQAKKIKEGIL